MFGLRWLPWKFIVRRVARAHGFLDPIVLMSHLRRFTQPSEVAEPVELLRAGVVLHARGLINSRVIQHNLDWVWPFWVERQFDPDDDAFIPRAFSITHINLAHRNWTAVGLPDRDELPIVDPRGLVTPHLDGWSLDAWIATANGRALLPSRAREAVQRLEVEPEDTLRVVTETRDDGLFLTHSAEVVDQGGIPELHLTVNARAAEQAWVAVALRPYNPEGISFVNRIVLGDGRRSWSVDGRPAVRFSEPVERHHISTYDKGDVYIHLRDLTDEAEGTCDVGMATAAAIYSLAPNTPREVTVRVPLAEPSGERRKRVTWPEALEGHAALAAPDNRFRFLYQAALRTLVLHSPGDVYPGPYTYKRFWFRDAAFIIHALLCAGFTARAERALDRFSPRQSRNGYFHSQEGEWDANGEALWIMERFCRITGTSPKPAWRTAIRRGGRWIGRKRLRDDGSPHGGLLPAGFSAEHLGPNDYYYWDDFWGIGGLRSAAWLARAMGEEPLARRFEEEERDFRAALERSLAHVAERLGQAAMPASPYRRMDAGAVGSLAAGYPLNLFAPDDPRLLGTADWLLENCLAGGGFFQDMIHSGINAYLTLHLAQVLLRAGDERHFGLTERVAELASPTGQWPEAIHPRTGGGCMGDGQHVWAAAEWVMMLRNGFVREEGERLILASGVPSGWLEGDGPVSFGPAPTAFGPVTVTLYGDREGKAVVGWTGAWHNAPPPVEVRLPGFVPARPEPGAEQVALHAEIAR